MTRPDTTTGPSGGPFLPAAFLSILMSASIGVMLPACASSTGGGPTPGTDSNVARAERFRSLLDHRDYDAARTLMANDARRWWNKREGEGRPWTVGPEARGPWAAWDEHFRSSSQVMEWREEPHAAIAVVRESNDYYRLLERGPMTNEIVYYFDEAGKIDGLLIRSSGDRPAGKTDEFVAWARANDPEELEALMPGGEVDPSGDHPERFRRILNRWRRATGLEPIESR